jgi:DNA topoisomerase-1
MATQLVIVESPAKAKTINKYLGPDYKVLASYGHIRDLTPTKGAVDPENHFAMRYELIEKNKKHVDAIVKALASANTLILATDPDREGEAISWHLQEYLKSVGALTNKKVQRVTFFEITKKAVQQAMSEPRELSMDLVDAQQARRALDYLVGFNLSPLLWKKVRRGLSAGRVQSPALKLIVEREIEIEAFKQQEYWSIEADLDKDTTTFLSMLTKWKGEKLETLSIGDGDTATQIEEFLTKNLGGTLTVSSVEKKQRKRQPTAPFTTSTLQQEAARKLGFSAKKTMMVAQQLYEGIDTGDGTEGLITYMRTDSMNLSIDSVSEIRAYIESNYGKDFLPDSPKIYKTKAKNAQEAHEAIRPTSVSKSPEALKTKLDNDQYKLYNLIFKRTIACQMIHASLETVIIDFACEDRANFHSTGSTITHPGFMRVYSESFDDGDNKNNKDDDMRDLNDEDKILPKLQVGDTVKINQIRKEQHFTQPPPRYSEASLVKTLEEFGIGRPSTYASIISTLTSREYVLVDAKRFKPTDIGRVVNKFLTEYFNRYVDYGFTSNLEDELDEISRGEKPWVPTLDAFWTPFVTQIQTIDKEVKRSDVTSEKLDENCPKCGKELSLRLGKSGRFIGCSGYPDCDYTRNTEHGTDQEVEHTPPEVLADRACPKCEKPLNIRQGRYGKFIGCSGYPKCKYIEPLVKPKTTEVRCPECQEGDLIERKSRYGKIFYSCNRYPDCKYAIWNKPIAERCPSCGLSILTIKTTKRHGTQKVCPHKNCGYLIGAPELAPDAGPDAETEN